MSGEKARESNSIIVAVNSLVSVALLYGQLSHQHFCTQLQLQSFGSTLKTTRFHFGARNNV